MVIDQDQTTQTDETQSSDQTNSSIEQDQGSSTSTTEGTEKIDLAADEDGDGSQQQDDTRTDEEKAADAAKAELFGAPAEGESYAIDGLPEGMEIDKDALEAVTPAFRELGLSSKGASLIAKTYAEKVLPTVMEGAVKRIESDVVAQRATWEGEALAAVKDNGKDLKNKAGEVLSFDAKDMKVVRSIAAKALDHLAPEGFREFLEQTGLSVHPAMVAFAYQAGKHLAEDREIEPTERGDRRKPAAATRNTGGMAPEKFYDH